MRSFRNRPNDNYIFDASWQDLYLLTEHWKSDLLFYKEDLNFLNHLVKSYFIQKPDEKRNVSAQSVENSLHETLEQCTNLLRRANRHSVDLAALIINPKKYDSYTFRAEHQQLEDDITNFVHTFQTNRKKVFEVRNKMPEFDD